VPTVNDMIKLIEVIQDSSLKDVGFIIGLKRRESTEQIYEKIQSMTSKSNILIEDFVP